MVLNFLADLLKVSDTLVVGQNLVFLSHQLLLDVDIVKSLAELLVHLRWLSLIEVDTFEKGVTLQLLIILGSIIMLVAEYFVGVHLEKLFQQVFYGAVQIVW